MKASFKDKEEKRRIKNEADAVAHATATVAANVWAQQHKIF